MPQINIVCKEETGFPIATLEPKASDRGVLTAVNLSVLRQFAIQNESMLCFA